MARTAGSCVAVVGTRSSNRSPRRPSWVRPLDSTICVVRSFVPGALGPRAAAVHPAVPPAGGWHDPVHGARGRRSTSVGYPARRRTEPWLIPPSSVQRACGCRAPIAGIGWPEMSASSGPEPSFPGPAGDEAVATLVAALDSAPAAVYFLTSAAEPVWANAQARALGTARSTLPLVAGRSIADVVEEVLRSGRSETICGALGQGDTATATAILRPMPLAGGSGVLLVLEMDAAETDISAWPVSQADLVEQAQQSLLPPSLPMLPDLRLSGSYHRASSARAAGGDWYDAVPLGAGWVALVVGDAVGHGVPAAGAMSRLRGAMRSTALRDPSPRVVLAALDAFAAEMEDVEGASVFYGVLDAGSGTLTYGAAGHPPPLVVHPDGRTSFLPGTPRPPLGSLPDVTTQISEHTLEQGATLVLFSNGAIAAPDASVPGEALNRLADVSRSVLRAPGALDVDAAADLASAIAEGVRRPQGWPDDVAVLVAHRREATLEPLHL